MAYKKVKYKNVNYYIDTEKKIVLDSQFNILSIKKINSLNFSSLEQFLFLLNNISSEPKKEFFDKSSFIALLSENLKMVCNGTTVELSEKYMEPLLKGLNYAIIKKDDFISICKILEKITLKEPILEYKYLNIEVPKEQLTKQIKKNKLFQNPLGKIEGSTVFGLPLVFSSQMALLTENR